MTDDSPKKRTIVRANDRLRVASVRASFGLLERFAPKAAGARAARLWCTLPGNAGRRRDERPDAGERSWLDIGDGRHVAVETWGFGPPVYLMHGWGGWRGQLGAFVTPLVDAGFRVIAVDAPSHGESAPGRLGAGRSLGPELTDTLVAATGRHGKPAAVVAHSLGCATTALAVHDGMPAARLVLIAPSIAVEPVASAFCRTVGLGPRGRQAMMARLEMLAGRPMSDYDIAGLGTRTELPPTLVVHDRDDKEVPYDQGVRLASDWPSAELATTEGLGHQRILRDRGVVDLVVGYVAG
ncbi:serine aminopeptidase S33 family [Haloactinopolyspora alba]|uniref:Serine aminopeptidase S33 family n=1 Tax=Haloactinopolyspora alba TaxID=648780 RepID=A0A2P8E9K3_9ACTN|nr:alpha/beta fold hydrolase [Haloactinopolyspora alba]PSL06097.1 serine aminopeptidase S33 family [Haloactinopolyspora alba]